MGCQQKYSLDEKILDDILNIVEQLSYHYLKPPSILVILHVSTILSLAILYICSPLSNLPSLFPPYAPLKFLLFVATFKVFHPWTSSVMFVP